MKPIRVDHIPASDLRQGDLMRCGVGNSYVLIADAWIEGGRVKATVYHGKTPAAAPSVDLALDADVALTGRNMRP